MQSSVKLHFYRDITHSAVNVLEEPHKEVRENLPSPGKTCDSVLMVLLPVKFRAFLQKKKLRRLSSPETL